MKNLTAQSLHDVIEACDEIGVYMDSVSLEHFLENRPLNLQIERLLEIVGEAMNRALKSDPELRDRIPHAFSIVGMRNRISHGYDAIVEEAVWDTAVNDIPRLRQQVNSLLSEH